MGPALTRLQPIQVQQVQMVEPEEQMGLVGSQLDTPVAVED